MFTPSPEEPPDSNMDLHGPPPVPLEDVSMSEEITRHINLSVDGDQQNEMLADLAGQENISKAGQDNPKPSEDETSKYPVIPGYEIVGKLGQGGMGTVYKARQISMDRLVGLKVLTRKMASNKSYIERFLREAKAAGRLNHPNIVQGIDVGETNGVYYFIMEYVDGPSLRSLLFNKASLTESHALEIVCQITQALEQASEAGIVHRDIKPDNIFISSKGVAKLGDLGLVKSIEQDQNVTMVGTVVGTPFFMSPEQARGEDVLDSRSDIYSLGVTLFNMLTGDVPFRGNSIAVTLAKHLREDVPDICEINPKISKSTRNILNKMMAKRVDDRYMHPTELLIDLRQAMKGSEVSATVLKRMTGSQSDDVIYKYSKVLSDDELVFSMIALKSRIITKEQLIDCLNIQELVAEGGGLEPLSVLMVERGYLDETQVKSILRTQEQHQREMDRKSFGQIIAAKNCATKEQIQAALEEQGRESEQGKATVLGDTMVQMGFITTQQKNEALQIQENARTSKEDIPFGKTVHSLCLVSTKEINTAVTMQKKLREQGERKQLSDILIETGALSPRERDVVMRAMKRMLVTGQSMEDLLIEQRIEERSEEASRIAGDDTVLFSEDDLIIHRQRTLECQYCMARLTLGEPRCKKCGKQVK